MSEVLNDRDAILQAAAVRIVNPKNASILLSASSSMFHLDSSGQVEVPVITITAALIGLEGDVTFTAEGATLSSITGKSAAVRYQDMQGPAAIVTARILAGGETFSQSCILATVRDGANGGSGARGAGMYFATGNAWSDGAADVATPGGNVVGDVVTISNGSTYSLTKRWDGANWLAMGAVFDGSLFVTGSIHGAALKAGTVDILAPDGKVILSAGRPLAQQVASNPNLVPTPVGWPSGNFYDRTYPARNGDGRFGDGQYIWFPPRTQHVYQGAESHQLRIPPGAAFTVSFEAYCDGAPSALWCDVYASGNFDANGIRVVLTNTLTRYSFTEFAPNHPDAPLGRLRFFSDTVNGSNMVVASIKVELGTRVTPWCDTVVGPGNSALKIMPDSISNVQFGGDLWSTNWNGQVGPNGAGWLLQRSGAFYCGSANIRGAIAGGYFQNWNWPVEGWQQGYYLGPEGLRLGNGYGQSFVHLGSNGDFFTPNLQVTGPNVNVRGTITGSMIRTSVLAMESARIATPNNRHAPFVLFDSGSVFRGQIGVATVNLLDFVGPAYGNEYTYHGKRFGSFRKDVFLKATVFGDQNWEELYIEVAYHGNYASWGTIASCSVFCEGRAGASIVARYTPWAGGWDIIGFRARTRLGRTLSLTFEMQVFNFNESTNPENSSGSPGGQDSGGGGVAPNPEPWCVDAETTQLPGGGFVRDVQVGDLMMCWNFDAENPGIEYAPVNKVAFGSEESTMLVTQSGVQIIQSNSTPMTVRDGRLVLTTGMLHEEVLINRGGELEWEKVTQTFDMGVRDVVKVSLHDRMYFAGMDPKATIATHNLEYKP